MFALWLDVYRAAAESLPPGTFTPLLNAGVLGSLAIVALFFFFFVWRNDQKTMREQRATIDALNTEFRQQVIPLLTRTAQALETVGNALADAAVRGPKGR